MLQANASRFALSDSAPGRLQHADGFTFWTILCNVVFHGATISLVTAAAEDADDDVCTLNVLAT